MSLLLEILQDACRIYKNSRTGLGAYLPEKLLSKAPKLDNLYAEFLNKFLQMNNPSFEEYRKFNTALANEICRLESIKLNTNQNEVTHQTLSKFDIITNILKLCANVELRLLNPHTIETEFENLISEFQKEFPHTTDTVLFLRKAQHFVQITHKLESVSIDLSSMINMQPDEPGASVSAPAPMDHAVSLSHAQKKIEELEAKLKAMERTHETTTQQYQSDLNTLVSRLQLAQEDELFRENALLKTKLADAINALEAAKKLHASELAKANAAIATLKKSSGPNSEAINSTTSKPVSAASKVPMTPTPPISLLDRTGLFQGNILTNNMFAGHATSSKLAITTPNPIARRCGLNQSEG